MIIDDFSKQDEKFFFHVWRWKISVNNEKDKSKKDNK